MSLLTVQVAATGTIGLLAVMLVQLLQLQFVSQELRAAAVHNRCVSVGASSKCILCDVSHDSRLAELCSDTV